MRKRLIKLAELNETIGSVISGIQSEKQLNDEQMYRIRLVMSELVVNIFKYSDADEVKLSAEYAQNKLHIILMDNGSGFESKAILEQNITERELLMRENGRGVFIVRKMTDSLRYSMTGNTVDVTLKL
ncbi:MAG: ATP-binding protein [Christensenella sp.]